MPDVVKDNDSIGANDPPFRLISMLRVEAAEEEAVRPSRDTHATGSLRPPQWTQQLASIRRRRRRRRRIGILKGTRYIMTMTGIESMLL